MRRIVITPGSWFVDWGFFLPDLRASLLYLANA